MLPRKNCAIELVQLVPLLNRYVGADLRCLDQSIALSHVRLLAVLLERPYHLAELAEQHMVTQATMSNTVATMVERGWVQRKASSTDRRKVMVSITPHGRQVFEAIHAQLEQRVLDRLAMLTGEELDMATAGLRILKKAFGGANDMETCTPGAPVEVDIHHRTEIRS